MVGRLHALTLALLIIISLPNHARADPWIGPSDTTVAIQASDEYPFCSAIDVETARKMARASFPHVRTAFIAAKGAAMEVLSKAGWVGQLERLSITTDDRGLLALASVRRLPRLVVLQIGTCEGELLGGKAVKALVSSRAFRNVERLSFAGGDSEAERSIDSKGVLAIAGTRLPRLKFLDLSWNPIDKDAVASLVSSALARQLEELNLCQTSIAVDAIIDARLTKLKRLCMSDLAGGAAIDARRRIDAAYPGILSPSTYWFDEP